MHPLSPPLSIRQAIRHPVVEACLLACLAIVIHLAGNGRTSLWDRDEPRYAQCTREMRASGDWVRPTFNGEPRNHKPVLIYWLMMVGYAVGGDNPYGARLVSAVMGAGTVLLTWGLGRRMFGPSVGRLAGLVLASAPIVVIEAKLATIDATLACVLVAAQVLLWRLANRDCRASAMGFWALMAAALLLKGPVGPLLIACAGAASWWWGGPTACWKRLRWRSGLILMLALVLPWYVAIGVLTRGEFFRFAIGSQIVERVASGIEDHGAPPGYYVATTLIGFYPWSAILPVGLFAAWKLRRSRPELAFLLGWVVGPWLVLECFQTKLIHYYLPALPACGLLAAWMIHEVAREAVPLARLRLGRVSGGLLVGVGLGLTIGLVGLAFAFPSAMRAPLLAEAVLVLVGTLLAVDRFRNRDALRAAVVLASTWSLVMFLAGAWLIPSAEPFRVSARVAARLDEWSTREQAEPVLANFQAPSVIYAYKRPITALRTYKDLIDMIEDGRPVVSALRDADFALFQYYPEVRVEVRETIRGFNLDKGRVETLHLTRISHRKPGAGSGSDSGSELESESAVPSIASAAGEQTLVK